MPALGRHPHFDPRSRQYPVRRTLPRRVSRVERVWPLPAVFPLNQGSEGACVGFGWSGELASEPVVIPASNTSAYDLYLRARAQDRLMGNDWTEGASVLAGAKAVKAAGNVSSYRWAFGLDDVIDTLVAKGPVVLGLHWYSEMYYTDPAGLVEVGGSLVGGHCILAHGYMPNHPTHGEVVVWTNSWGSGYGLNGRAFIRVADLGRLLSEDGEACIAVDTARPVESWWRRWWRR